MDDNAAIKPTSRLARTATAIASFAALAVGVGFFVVGDVLNSPFMGQAASNVELRDAARYFLISTILMPIGPLVMWRLTGRRGWKTTGIIVFIIGAAHLAWSFIASVF